VTSEDYAFSENVEQLKSQVHELQEHNAALEERVEDLENDTEEAILLLNQQGY